MAQEVQKQLALALGGAAIAFGTLRTFARFFVEQLYGDESLSRQESSLDLRVESILRRLREGEKSGCPRHLEPGSYDHNGLIAIFEEVQTRISVQNDLFYSAIEVVGEKDLAILVYDDSQSILADNVQYSGTYTLKDLMDQVGAINRLIGKLRSYMRSSSSVHEG